MRINRIAKAVVGAVGTVATAITAALADEVRSLDEGAQLASTLVLAAATRLWRVACAEPGG